MILIVAAALCALSVPLTGGSLGRLAELRLRGLWLPILALAVQVMITTVVPDGPRGLYRALHIATYALLAAFLLYNRALPGLPIVAAGFTFNAVAIIANGGVMPAAVAAQRLAGLRLGSGFNNSAHVAHPALLWLGDVIPWPGPLPNVLSIGDVLVFAGMLVLLQRVCRQRGDGAPALTGVAGPQVDPLGSPPWTESSPARTSAPA